MEQRTDSGSPLQGFRVETQPKQVTLCEEASGVGIRFNEGERFSGYTASIVLNDLSVVETEEGVREVSEASERLRQESQRLYPLEFSEIKS